ncbi:MAG TPA: hypothetical protein VIK13_05675 [Candidatus Limnocylindrales bacterium]
MELKRCLAGTATLAVVALAGVLGAAHPPVLAAVDPPWQPPPCPEASAGGPAAPSGTAAAWYRLDPVLDDGGSLAGQRLTLGLIGGPPRHVDLPPESSASGPVHGSVLVSEDDGTESRLRLLDVGRACETVLARERSVIRGALLALDGTTAWEHRVDRATRADQGVWRRPLAGGVPTRVLAGLPADEAFGPTFVTELSWLADGRLGVASCGERACRTRVLDPATGHTSAFEGTGPLLGVEGDIGVAVSACAGLPCPIETIDLGNGRRRTLLDAAGSAAVDDGVLVFESADGSIAALDLASGRTRAVAVDHGLLPVRRTSSATSGAEIAAGSVLLAPGGRLDHPSDGRRLDTAARTVHRLGEVAP